MLSYTVNETQRLVRVSSVPEENLKGGKRPQNNSEECTIKIDDEAPPVKKKQTSVVKKASGTLPNNKPHTSSKPDNTTDDLEAEKVKEQMKKDLKEKLERVKQKLREQEENLPSN